MLCNPSDGSELHVSTIPAKGTPERVFSAAAIMMSSRSPGAIINAPAVKRSLIWVALRPATTISRTRLVAR